MSPVLNGSSAIQHFKGSDVIEIRDGITFNFYMGLPHMYKTLRDNYRPAVSGKMCAGFFLLLFKYLMS